ncbi:hypothetical protein C8Q70DRAFT_190180 [Cubamyces menziesii]|nr:hypothetical protein C8Q70DRAFT_190180 [Cubamyces menziesii]
MLYSFAPADSLLRALERILLHAPPRISASTGLLHRAAHHSMQYFIIPSITQGGSGVNISANCPAFERREALTRGTTSKRKTRKQASWSYDAIHTWQRLLDSQGVGTRASHSHVRRSRPNYMSKSKYYEVQMILSTGSEGTRQYYTGDLTQRRILVKSVLINGGSKLFRFRTLATHCGVCEAVCRKAYDPLNQKRMPSHVPDSLRRYCVGVLLWLYRLGFRSACPCTQHAARASARSLQFERILIPM